MEDEALTDQDWLCCEELGSAENVLVNHLFKLSLADDPGITVSTTVLVGKAAIAFINIASVPKGSQFLNKRGVGTQTEFPV